MKLIIAGSRGLSPTVEEISEALKSLMLSDTGRIHVEEVTEIVSGRARGVDQAGERWAAAKGIAVKPFPVNVADHQRHVSRGEFAAAAKARNRAMAEYADAALVFWDEDSPGSANMVTWMVAMGKPVHVVRMCKRGQR